MLRLHSRARTYPPIKMCLMGKANNLTANPIEPHKKNIHVVIPIVFKNSGGVLVCAKTTMNIELTLQIRPLRLSQQTLRVSRKVHQRLHDNVLDRISRRCVIRHDLSSLRKFTC